MPHGEGHHVLAGSKRSRTAVEQIPLGFDEASQAGRLLVLGN